MKYDFTGKERDAETSYDYFGARYFDSRVGRWGQVEPILDKHVSWSPYSYIYCNPQIAIDGDGRDGIVTISGNKITITLDITYASGDKFSFPGGDESHFRNAMGEGIQEWNEAAKDGFIIDGKEYSVEFKLIQSDENKELSDQEVESIYYGETDLEGRNIAIFGEKNNNPALTTHNIFLGVSKFYAVGYEREFKKSWGAHEIGHALGLKHLPTKYQKSSKNIMSWNKNRHKPTNIDVWKIVRNIDVNKATSVIKGDHAEEKH